ncbi:hypothetical protein LTR62_006625 [Meristemomyces frigidus]|uniref:Thioredoxin domain-containing protein n=1 Tax=Meristemomyces frigidus TaxID=1508187 RepID=A0AAN7TMJ4_9PEZI|nr:hypothetical protein LTR62_006625 [Meristemomyces frigidus]
MYTLRSPPARTALPSLLRHFHATRRPLVQVGDAVPNTELMESSPGNKLSLSQHLGKTSGKALIIGVPGAFSPACSASHIPSYLTSPNLKEAGQVFVVSVNDPFVMKAWGEALNGAGGSGIRFLADPQGAFTRALDLEWDATAAFGQPRSKRYALKIEDGKVKEVFVEPDNTGVDVSAADKVLG